MNRVIILFLISSLYAQSFDQNAFIKRVRTSYYSYDVDTTFKVNSSVTTQSFVNYLQTKTNETLQFPVVIEWTNLFRLNLTRSEMVLSTSDFDEQRSRIMELAANFLGVWSQFSLELQIPDAAMNYSFDQVEDRIIFRYVQQSGKNFNHITKTFGLNGMLLSSVIRLADQSSIVANPKYTVAGDKWLCQGWTYQKTNSKGIVEEGMETDIIYKEVNGFWYPFDVILQIQTQQTAPNLIYERIYFRDYLIDGEIVN